MPSLINKYFVRLASVSIILLMLFINILTVRADEYGLDATAGQVNAFKAQVDDQQQADSFLQTKTGQIIGLVLSFVGVIFLVLMIIAGITWMTAGGNDEKIKKARGLMIGAIQGLLIVLGAYAITAFIGQQLTITN